MSADKGIVPFLVSLLVCWFACNLPADTWPIRIKVQVFRGDADGERLVSALSGEFRKLDGVTVDDMQPAVEIHCVVLDTHEVVEQSHGRSLKGYEATVAVVMTDNRLMTLSVHSSDSVDALAHEIAINIDGKVLEGMRRSAKPSSSPLKFKTVTKPI